MRQYFRHHYHKYPQSEIQDYFKLLKQMCFGPKHFIKSESESLERLTAEVNSLGENPFHEDLYDYVGPNFARINLRPYVDFGLDLQWLNSAFVFSSLSTKQIPMEDALTELSSFLEEIFPKELVRTEIENYKAAGFPTLNHSERYRQVYMPSYRVVESGYIKEEMRIKQIQNFLKKLPQKNLTIIAIDGPSCSGKSTISAELEKRENLTLIGVDDFFDGSNEKIGINSSRIKEEILLHLKPGETLEYRSYNCSNKSFIYKRKEVKNLVILEGVYSANSSLSSFYDAVIYFEISEEEQLQRLRNRSPRLFPRFLGEWLPREKEYFQKEKVYENSDLIV